MPRERMSVSVTYDLVTEESVQDGDTADNGYIHPTTEQRRSFSNGRRRDVERNMRLARAGKLDFPSLRAAFAFIDNQSCAHHETCWSGNETTLSVRATDAYQGLDIEECGGSLVLSVSYDLHIEGVSNGTLDRLARVLASNRVYCANRRQLRRLG